MLIWCAPRVIFEIGYFSDWSIVSLHFPPCAETGLHPSRLYGRSMCPFVALPSWLGGSILSQAWRHCSLELPSSPPASRILSCGGQHALAHSLTSQTSDCFLLSPNIFSHVCANLKCCVWILISWCIRKGLPLWFSVKEPTCKCRRCGFHPWVGKIPWRRKWLPTPLVLPEKSHGHRRLVGYSPQGLQE